MDLTNIKIRIRIIPVTAHRRCRVAGRSNSPPLSPQPPSHRLRLFADFTRGSTESSPAQEYHLLQASFFSFGLCGRYGRLYGVTAWSNKALTVSDKPFWTAPLYDYTIKSTLALTMVLHSGIRIRIRSDPLILGPPYPVLFSKDPDPDHTCNDDLQYYFHLEQNKNKNQHIQA